MNRLCVFAQKKTLQSPLICSHAKLQLNRFLNQNTISQRFNKSILFRNFHSQSFFAPKLHQNVHYRHYRAKSKPNKDLYDYVYEEGSSEPNTKDHLSTWYRNNSEKANKMLVVIALMAAYYLYHLDEVPISGRKRFMTVTPAQEQEISTATLQSVLRQYQKHILPSSHPLTLHTHKIAARIMKKYDPNARFRVFVIDQAGVANAFVLPNGDIFVFTGILPITKNDAGLATILGHELAHKIARHSAEKISIYNLVNVVWFAAKFVFGLEGFGLTGGIIRELFINLPFSRKCESEADRLGLLLMAEAGYDPSEAVCVWQRMEAKGGDGSGKGIVSFMSTHPSHGKRIEMIQSWLPEARQRYEECIQDSYTWPF